MSVLIWLGSGGEAWRDLAQPDDPALSSDTLGQSEKISEKGPQRWGKDVLWFCIFILIVLRQITTHWAWLKRFFSLCSLTKEQTHYLDISRAAPALCPKVSFFNCPDSPGPQSWRLSCHRTNDSDWGGPRKGGGGILIPHVVRDQKGGPEWLQSRLSNFIWDPKGAVFSSLFKRDVKASRHDF